MSLLAIEWLKIRNYRAFWIVSGLFALLTFGINLLISTGVLRMGPAGINILDQGYGFPEVWSSVGWWASIFILFLAVVVITITCNEYSFRTHRQNIIDGWSRLSFFHSKIILVLALSAAATFFYIISSMLLGLIKNGFTDGMFSDLKTIGYFFLLTINYLMAGLTLAFLIKRSGLAIALFMMYAMFIEWALSKIVNEVTKTSIGEFFPLQVSDDLIPFRMQKMGGSAGGFMHLPSEYALLAGTLVWICIYYIAGRLLVVKRDL